MAKKVKGFMSEDGTFFETKAEAEYHDAKGVIVGLLIGAFHQPENIVEFLEQNHEAVEAYIKAYQVKLGHEAEVRDAEEYESRGGVEYYADDSNFATRRSQDDPNSSDDSGGEEDATPVQQQPPRVTEHLPDLGRSVSAKEIRDGRKKHGARSRKGNARRVRGRADLATRTSAEPSKTR